ncbi:MAG: aminotransferase class I/II-fold pyridoxal phosphate-dependent enzyme [Defluviitaleaceae bacterium]|nr:aminotransferase class I/II-fold pyridoxal phosphate-dependent enzyme [Defluviitaleaceae bacterium]
MSFLSEKARRLTPYVAGLQPKESGWIKLNTNENPYPPSPRVIEVIKNADIEKLRFYPDGESGVLKTAIAGALVIGEGKIFCANSSDEVLALAFQAFFSGKKNVLTPNISYGFYPVWGEIYDVGLEFVALREDFSINPDDCKSSNGVVIANPNAPTSLALELSDIEKILKQNPNGVVLIDEAYIDFAQVESAVSLIDSYENLLVVRTFSKSHSLAGLRVGYAMGQTALIDGLCRIRDAFNSYPLDMLAQNGAAAAISDTDYLKETSSRVISTRKKTIEILTNLGFYVLPSQANFIFMKAGNAQKLYSFLLENKILVRFWNKPILKDFLRVSIGTDDEMEVFCECVKRFLNEKQEKHS